MALDTFVLGPNPKWYFVNNNGKPLAGGLFNTYSSLNNQVRKPVYTTASGLFPWPNPIPIDANGTLGPLYFAFDSTQIPQDGYLIIVTDALGQVIWTIDDYFGAGGSGGGDTTTVVSIENLINNNIFWRHSASISPVPILSVIAPSNHANLVGNGTTTTAAPDIIFVKNNQSSTDQITFPLFTPLGNIPFGTDPTPIDYFNYTCTVPGTETIKYLQFPITAKVQNLSQQDVIGSFWAKSSTSGTITLKWLQYFGDGAGASTADNSIINTFNLTPTWTKFPFSATVPDVDTKVLGAPNFQGPNDALFLRFEFTLLATSIDLTKPTMYLGTGLPQTSFINYDNIDSVIALPRTGDVRTSMNSFIPFGWVPCNDGVLSNGDGAIVPPTNPTVPVARNNIDTYPLYSLIWNMTSGYSSFAPIYTNAGVLTTRGASAILDFSAGKQLSLTKMLGRVLSGTNPTLIASQTFTANTVTDTITVTDSTQFPRGTPVLLTTTGSLPTPLDTLNVPAIYYAVPVNPSSGTTLNLASSEDNALAGIFMDITGVGVGVQTIQSAIGTYFGQGLHQLTVPEMPSHAHTARVFSGGPGPVNRFSNFNTADPQSGTAQTEDTGSSLAHNTMQPTAFLNVMLKL